MPVCHVILPLQYFRCIMAKKKNDKSDRNKDGMNTLSKLLLYQNESLLKLLEELSRQEKENDKKSADTKQYSN